MQTYKVELEQTTQTKLKSGGFLLPWLVRHAAWSMTRFKTYKDGHSAYYRLFGAEYKNTVLKFAEVCMARVPGIVGPGPKNVEA